ncbi:retrovirus-related pol polyprotein from transposon TNT 1-94, partial [Tanacetum coccineum]
DSFSDNQNALEIPEYFKNNDLKAQLQAKDTTICKLKEHIKSMRENDKEEKVKHEMDEIKTINIELEHSVAKLLYENERLNKEIEHLKKIYKDQFDSIKKTRALSKEHCDSLIAQLKSKSMENADLKGQIQENIFVTTTLQNELRRLKGKHVLDNATIIAPGIFKLDIEPISHRLKNNRDTHEDYLKKTIENTNTELLVYVSQTCPSFIKPSEKLVAVTPMNKVKKVRFSEPLTSSSNIYKQVESSKTPYSNTPVLPSTGLKSSTSASRSQPTCNKKNDRISQTPDSNTPVLSSTGLKCYTSTCRSQPTGNKKNDRILQKPRLKWKPTGRLFTIVGNSCPLTSIAPKKILHLKETTSNSVEIPKPEIKVYSRRPKQIKSVGSSKKAKMVEYKIANNLEPNHLWGSNATDVPSSSSLVNDRLYRLVSVRNGKISKITRHGDYHLDSKIANNLEPNHNWGSTATDVPSSYSLVNDRFGNDQIAKIMGYGDYQLGNVTISRVYYVEGLKHNLFLVGQFCDSDLEVAFQKNTCFIWNLEGVDLLSGSRETNLYTISLDDMLKTSLICLLSKSLKTKSWLWHHRLSHLNFGTLNKLAKDGLARGIPKLKFKKDHMCSACALGKTKKSSHQPKAEDTNQKKLYLIHMDLCGPMRMESINGKEYILVIVDDYSRFTWVKFLRSKDEAPDTIIKCIKNIQVR